MTTRQIAFLEKHNALVNVGEPEPEAPAAGPLEQSSDDRGPKSETIEMVQDLWSERWPRIDIDDSLRLLALPPRSLRR